MKGYLQEIINFGGEHMPRGRAILIMQKEGFSQSQIDFWMAGYNSAMKARKRPTAQARRQEKEI